MPTPVYVSTATWNLLTREQLSFLHRHPDVDDENDDETQLKTSRLAAEELWAAIFYEFLHKAQSHY